MEGAERDSTQDWLVPPGAGPPLLSELELKVDEALAIARSSEAAVNVVGEAALDAARQARRAAELAESASAAALEASRAVCRPADGEIATPSAERHVEEDSVAPPVEEDSVAPSVEHPAEDEALRRFTERAERIAARLQAV